MSSRREEIQAKRARLEEIKRQRARRESEFAASRQSLSSSTQKLSSPSSSTNDRQDLDSLISSLVGEPLAPPLDKPSSSSTAPIRFPSRIDFAASDVVPSQDESPGLPTVPRATQDLSFTPMHTVYEIKTERSKPQIETTSKGIQTVDWGSSSQSSSSDSEIESQVIGERPPMRHLSRRQRQQERERKTKLKIRQELQEELMTQAANAAVVHNERSQKKEGSPRQDPALLTSRDLDKVTISMDFLDFLDRSSKVVEKALYDDYDVLEDYRLETLNDEDDDQKNTGEQGKRGRRVKEVMQFYDEKWSKKRMITDLQFSEKFPELVLASYTKNSSAPYDPDGVIQVWNLHMQDRAEYVFHATSDILTAKFHPFYPNLILGGSYSGQVYLWDTRSRRQSPVQQTPLTGSGHTHPIYSLNVVGTQNAHNIITTSTDGILCSWATDMLSTPQQQLLLRAPQWQMNPPPSKIIPNTRSPFKNDLSVTCTAFPPSQTSYLLAGTAQGPIHLCHRHDRAGAPAGVDQHVYYRAHGTPVMSLDFHNAIGSHNLGDLLLSTGLDWSINLWRVKTPSGAAADIDRGKENIIEPLLEIPRDDAVYDAKWSPARPAVFASVDGAGWLEVWDLNVDLEAPVARERPAPRRYGPKGEAIPGLRSGDLDSGDHNFMASMNGLGSGRSLNKCTWEPGDGSKIAVGGLDGSVSIFELGRDLCGVEGAKAEEWDGVKKLISRLEGVGL